MVQQEELAHCPIIDITEEHNWDPYNEANINAVNVEQQRDVHFAEETIEDYLLESHTRQIRAMQVSKPKDRLTPEYLSQIWNCGIETAKKQSRPRHAGTTDRAEMECNIGIDLHKV